MRPFYSTLDEWTIQCMLRRYFLECEFWVEFPKHGPIKSTLILRCDNVTPCEYCCHVDSRATKLRCSLNFGSNVINLPCVVCLTICVLSPYSSIYPEKKCQSYVILIEFKWNGLKVSEVNNLKSS